MQDKPVIIFVSAVYPSQYSLLCSHLRASGAADSWFMTMPGHAENYASQCDHLLSFRPDGDIVGLNIPNGQPLVYELDENLKPIKHYYLGDQDAIAAAMAAVANQGKAK